MRHAKRTVVLDACMQFLPEFLVHHLDVLRPLIWLRICIEAALLVPL
jgi:hypothetical protein